MRGAGNNGIGIRAGPDEFSGGLGWAVASAHLLTRVRDGHRLAGVSSAAQAVYQPVRARLVPRLRSQPAVRAELFGEQAARPTQIKWLFHLKKLKFGGGWLK